RAAAVVSVEAAAVVERGAALGQRTGAGILAAALHGTPPERGRLGVVHHAHRAGRAIHLEARVVGGLVDAAGLALGDAVAGVRALGAGAVLGVGTARVAARRRRSEAATADAALALGAGRIAHGARVVGGRARVGVDRVGHGREGGGFNRGGAVGIPRRALGIHGNAVVPGAGSQGE